MDEPKIRFEAPDPDNELEVLADTGLRAMERGALMLTQSHGALRFIACINGGGRGELGSVGYTDGAELFVDLFMHLQALAKTQGKEVSLIPIKARGRG